MNDHNLTIQLRNSEGAVLRALGLMERRGFQLHTCTVTAAQDDGRGMAVCVMSSRPAELLKKQLERLHDVLWVEITPPAVQLAEHRETQP